MYEKARDVRGVSKVIKPKEEPEMAYLSSFLLLLRKRGFGEPTHVLIRKRPTFALVLSLVYNAYNSGIGYAKRQP
jgi:hypothetical protein